MEIRLYDNNLAAPIFEGNIRDRVQGLNFSTKLPGGFNLCTARLKADLPEAWEWLMKRILYRIVIADGEKILWEGRIQDPGITPGHVEFTAYGYYSSLNDQPYKTAFNDNADVVIKAMLTAAAPQIAADQSHIDATSGPPITSAADVSYLDQSLRKLIEKLATFGDTSGNQWYFAIWENRVPYFFQRSVSSVNWNVRLSDLRRFKLKYQAADLWNKAYAIYTAGGALTRTADAQDITSQAKYGLIRYHSISNLGEVAAAAAQAQRDRWLAEHKDLWPSLEEFTLGDMVFDTNGVPYPSSRVRAGDVIRVLDLVPATGDLDSVTRDAKRTFYILETDYSLDRSENRLVVDTESKNLDSIIARKI